LLEASIVLAIALHKYYEAAVIAALPVFNAALACFQEGRARATLAALKSRLALNASIQRDGAWKTVPAAELVCGDLVKLAVRGIAMAPLPILIVGCEFAAAIAFGAVLDVVKIPVVARLQIS
jgi:H+-transporting ATPase